MTTSIGVIVFFVLAGVVWGVLAWRHRLKAPPLARPARRPAPAVRAAEGAVLGLLGAALLLSLVQVGPVFGYLKTAAEHYPELLRAWLTVVLASAAGLAVVLAVAALWRPAAAVLLMIAWLVGTVSCLTTAWPKVAAALGATLPDKPLVFYTLAPDPDFPHVQLYVNGVHLGEAPVTMPMDEFLAKVPYWPQPPEGLTEHELVSPDSQKVSRPWTRFETPGYTVSLRTMERAEQRKYYAQAELDGEWGSGFGGGGGGGGAGLVHNYESNLSFRFPKFDARVREHLEKALALGAAADDRWVATAESFGNRGWQLLRKMVAEDARYQRVLDQWARLRYGLAEPMAADEARQTLERVVAEADKLGGYSTYSVAGAAIDLIAPHLDVGWLVRAANDAIRRGGTGYSLSRGDDGFSSSGGSMRRYVLAHAVWRTDQRLDAADDSHPNPIETKVLPTLVYCERDSGKHNTCLDLATQGGWPGAFDFVYRHNWGRQVSDWSDDDAIRVGENQFVNAWLLRLLKFDTPEGREFRTKFPYWAFDVAEKAVRASEASVEMDHLSFLFLDADLGTESLAVKFWPRFLKATESIMPNNGYWGLLSRVKYLARTEPNATDEMYREALAATTGELPWIPVEGLDRLPPKRQGEILDIWIAQLREIAAHPPKVRQPWMNAEQLSGPLGQIGQLERKQKELRSQKKP